MSELDLVLLEEYLDLKLLVDALDRLAFGNVGMASAAVLLSVVDLKLTEGAGDVIAFKFGWVDDHAFFTMLTTTFWRISWNAE